MFEDKKLRCREGLSRAGLAGFMYTISINQTCKVKHPVCVTNITAGNVLSAAVYHWCRLGLEADRPVD